MDSVVGKRLCRGRKTTAFITRHINCQWIKGLTCAHVLLYLLNELLKIRQNNRLVKHFIAFLFN